MRDTTRNWKDCESCFFPVVPLPLPLHYHHPFNTAK